MDPKTADGTMREYYRERAPVYDRVYQYPERQDDLRRLESLVAQTFAGRDVLEIAAGTGYWSQFILQQASSLLATDATPETLDELNSRGMSGDLQTLVCDAFDLAPVASCGQEFSGAFAGLWFSHIPVQRRHIWLDGLNAQLAPGATLLLIDNSLRQCEQWPIVKRDDAGNTYQERTTDAGECYEVIKNFPTGAELDQLTAPFRAPFNASESAVSPTAKFISLDHFWCYVYVAKT